MRLRLSSIVIRVANSYAGPNLLVISFKLGNRRHNALAKTLVRYSGNQVESRSRIEFCANSYHPVFQGEYPGWSFELSCVQAGGSDEGQEERVA